MKRKQLKLKRARRAERKRTAHRELIELLKRLDFQPKPYSVRYA